MAKFSVAGLVLAGGASQRMGQDKRFLFHDGVSFLDRTVENARAVSDEVWVLVATEAEAARLRSILDDDVSAAFDRVPHGGPMAALAGALPRVSTDTALLLSVDCPLLTSEFLTNMIRHVETLDPHPQLAVPQADGRWQMTCALYDATLRTSVVDAVDHGERSLRDWASALSRDAIYVIPETTWRAWGPPEVFHNVNTPADYERLTTRVDSTS